MVVLDSSAALAIVKDSPEGRALANLMLSNEKVVAPNFFYCEVANAIWKYEHQGLWGGAIAGARLQKALELVDEFYPVADLTLEAYGEAMRLDHSVYDLYYLVLARRCNATLFTLDKQLIKLCQITHVNCLEEVEL